MRRPADASLAAPTIVRIVEESEGSVGMAGPMTGVMASSPPLGYAAPMRKRRRAVPAPVLMAELALASWETIARRVAMMAQSTCSPAEYRRMTREKASAAVETAKLLSAPQGVSVEAFLRPWHRRATANAKRLRKT